MSYITTSELKNNNIAKKELLKQETYSRFPYLIKVTVGNDVYRYANYFENIVFNGETYNAGYFLFTPPEQTTEGIRDSTLTLSDVDQFWTEKVRTTNATETIQVDFVAIILYDQSNDVSVCEIENYTFNCTSVTWNGVTMDMTLAFDDRLSINVPCDIADSVRCSGCA